MTRIAVIDRDLCTSKDCPYQCMSVCPVNKKGEDCIFIEEETEFPVIDENLCIGCGLCIKRCDGLGHRAINIVNLPEQLKENPVHRFGVNKFVLYRLPYPVEGSVVGIVGSNGLGKTTALQVLVGEISPNLGELEKKVDFSDLVTLFRGTEIQSYLKMLQDRKVKVSYKTQRVDKIPKVYSGKVSKLLDKTNERGILNDLIDRLALNDVLDDKIDSISGGELQRVAVAACLSKDADIYYFDEPTSFLDVFQRLEVSKAIRKFCSSKSTIVVDHDLATLDFLADRIHVFYGVPGVYGIVSNPYSVRIGINAFLDGYLKEENMRIRPKSIVFETGFVSSQRSEEVLIEFENIQKRLADFHLTIRRGKLYRQEVVGILGANALGKTTFAKILAGEMKLDEGSIGGKVKISHKPQYPHTDFEGTVRELLKSVTKEFGTDAYKSEIIRPLELEKLLEKNVKNLSGGELQRVAVAVSLSRESDIYLLDEPSAFLDVEQRLNLAKVIRRLVEKRGTSVMIIDHDLLFLSQIADRAMVFLGKPGKEGFGEEPTGVEEALNVFLSRVNVTFRRDAETGRPRANKLNSKLDREQRKEGKYFY